MKIPKHEQKISSEYSFIDWPINNKQIKFFFLIKQLYINLPYMSEAIKVVVRVRPMNNKQKDRDCASVIEVDQQINQLRLVKPDDPNNTKSFTYDNVFGQSSQQELVYSKTAYSLVENVLLGYNGTIFAYGQTGCGKTHSMVGRVDVEQLQGIIPRCFGHILSYISNAKDKQFLIRCSFIQIYNEQVRDLLSSDVKAKLQIKQSPEKGVFIKNLSINTAKTHEEFMEFMNVGNKNRSVGETAMNKDSSRSHLLFMLYLESAEVSLTNNEEKRYVASKLNLVDLAGSERLSKTGAEGHRLKQAQKINLSLSALGNVISALADGKSHHIPYRDSKLTRLLQDSLGGNTKTVMIANCSPADYNYDQTLSTLRYASRAKFIKNKPIINEDPKDAMLKEYAEQIKRLKLMLSQQTDVPPIAIKSTDQNQIDEKLKQKEIQLLNQKQQKRQLQQKIKQLEKIYVFAGQVHVDKKIKNAVERASLINKEDMINSQLKEGTFEEDEEKKIQKAQDLVQTQQIKLKYKSLVKKLKEKLKSLENEIKDINHENYVDKEIILEDVRSLNKQNQLLQGIIEMMLRPHQIQAVRSTSLYNQQKQQWRIPPFYLKSKQLVLPKLNDNQSLEMIKQMQQGRNLSWQNPNDEIIQNNSSAVAGNNIKVPFRTNLNAINLSSSMEKLKQPWLMGNNNCGNQEKKKFTLKDIIKDARNDTKLGGSQSGPQLPNEKKMLRKLQLQPIKREGI